MTSASADAFAVPPPEPPDSPSAWYAPRVHDQYELHPGVVATVRSADRGFAYDVRVPGLSAAGERALERTREHFAAATLTRPLTRSGTRERLAAGLDEKYRRVVDRLVELSPAARRRLTYHALAELRGLGAVTPYALDDRIEVAETRSGELVVHLTDYAPAYTGVEDPPFVGRLAADRLARYTVDFQGFSVPVVLYRENVLGEGPFSTRYAVREPDQLPGDEALVAECKERIWETDVEGVVEDRATFVRERAREFFARRLAARDTRAWRAATSYRIREALAAYDLAVPPVERRFAPDRLDDLIYYVVRDLVGYGQLTVPILDGNLEDVEANRVGERVKVVPRDSVSDAERVPTNLAFEAETAFVNVVTQLAADDGVELNAATPSAKVNLDPPGVEGTMRCALALPVVSEGGPHISVRKQSRTPLTPVDLVERGALPVGLVALLWMAYEHHCVVLFAGPTGVGKTTLLNAFTPFIPYHDRPISIDEGSREVYLPHETGVSLTTRDHEHEFKRVTMADLMTEANYLNPDVEVIAEVNTPASFETFAETLNTGHGLVGTTHADGIERLVNRVVEQGLPAYLLREIDLVVFPRQTDGERYVGEVVELVGDDRAGALDCTTVEKGATTLHWHRVCERVDGAFEFALDESGETTGASLGLFDRLARRTDRPVDAVEREFARKRQYVEYLIAEGVADPTDLFAFLADLRTNEAATVERAADARRSVAGDD
ncbi:MAG: type II/IV secretion system ATPase subunit [Haloarculaceae archaeon]